MRSAPGAGLRAGALRLRALRGVLLGVLVVALLLFVVAPPWVEASRNRVRAPGPYPVAPGVAELHQGLLVADLHADSLLWARDLAQRGSRGHLDLPRLVAGGVGIQVFGVVTSSPRGQNIHRTSGDGLDNITLLALAQRWPPATWTSTLARARYQARRLRDLAAHRPDRLVVVRTRGQLEAALARRATGQEVVAGLLGVEGAHCLEGDPENLDVLVHEGVRMLGLAHFFDNAFAGSAHGVERHGLSEAGRALVRRAEAAGVILDLAHASPRAFDETLALATRPLVVSHTGVKGTCDNPRNLSDEQLKGVAATGGVVGIGFWQTATCGPDAGSIARAIRHAVQAAGPDHVALGSDFDGSVTTPFDAAGLPRLTAALRDTGLDDAVVAKVMGENVRRVLLEALPE